MAGNGSISPQWHHANCRDRGERQKSNHGQTMVGRKLEEPCENESSNNDMAIMTYGPETWMFNKEII